MKNKNKINNNILKILMLTIILIASITITMIINVIAADLDVDNVVNGVYDGTIVKEYNASSKAIISKNDFLNNIIGLDKNKHKLQDRAYTALLLPSVYCLKHRSASNRW